MISDVSPVLHSSISKSEVSTQAKLRYHIKRELNLLKQESELSRLSLRDMFETMCKHELDFQGLASDLSLSCFCRTVVVNTSVILEADFKCESVHDFLTSMSFTVEDAGFIAKYLLTLHLKTCLEKNPRLKKLVNTKFNCEENRQKIVKWVFEQPLQNLQKNIDCCSSFNEKELMKSIDKLTHIFSNHSLTVIHGNFASENVVVKEVMRCGGRIMAYGGELTHFGNPAYDVGTIVGDLLIWHYLHESMQEDHEAHRNYCLTLQQAIIELLTIYMDDLSLCVTTDEFASDMMGFIAGFAGIAMLFRTMGHDWNNEKITLPSTDVRNDILGCAYRLITSYERIRSPNQMMVIGLMLT